MANPPVSMSLRPRLGGLPDIEADNADREGALQVFLARQRGGTPQPSETKGNGTTQFEALGAARARQGPAAAQRTNLTDEDYEALTVESPRVKSKAENRENDTPPPGPPQTYTNFIDKYDAQTPQPALTPQQLLDQAEEAQRWRDEQALKGQPPQGPQQPNPQREQEIARREQDDSAALQSHLNDLDRKRREADDEALLYAERAPQREASNAALTKHLSQYDDDPVSQALATIEFRENQRNAKKADRQKVEDEIANQYDDPVMKALKVTEYRTKQRAEAPVREAQEKQDLLERIKLRNQMQADIEERGYGSSLVRETRAALERGGASLVSTAARLFGDNEAADQLNREIDAYGEAGAKARGGDLSPYVSEQYGGIAESIAKMYAIPGGMFGKAVGGGLMTGNKALTEAEDAGVTGGARLRYAATQGGLEVLFEVLGNKYLGGGVQGRMLGKEVAARTFKELVKNFGKDAIKELPGELLTTIGQAASSKLEGVNPNMTWADLSQQLVDTAVATVGMSAVVNVPNAARIATGTVQPAATPPVNRSNRDNLTDEDFEALNVELPRVKSKAENRENDTPPPLERGDYKSYDDYLNAIANQPTQPQPKQPKPKQTKQEAIAAFREDTLGSQRTYDAAVAAGMEPLPGTPNRAARAKYAKEERIRIADQQAQQQWLAEVDDAPLPPRRPAPRQAAPPAPQRQPDTTWDRDADKADAQGRNTGRLVVDEDPDVAPPTPSRKQNYAQVAANPQKATREQLLDANVFLNDRMKDNNRKAQSRKITNELRQARNKSLQREITSNIALIRAKSFDGKPEPETQSPPVVKQPTAPTPEQEDVADFFTQTVKQGEQNGQETDVVKSEQGTKGNQSPRDEGAQQGQEGRQEGVLKPEPKAEQPASRGVEEGKTYRSVNYELNGPGRGKDFKDPYDTNFVVRKGTEVRMGTIPGSQKFSKYPIIHRDVIDQTGRQMWPPEYSLLEYGSDGKAIDPGVPLAARLPHIEDLDEAVARGLESAESGSREYRDLKAIQTWLADPQNRQNYQQEFGPKGPRPKAAPKASPVATGEPSPDQSPKEAGPVSKPDNWRTEFDAETDPYKKTQLLRSLANMKSTPKELSDILDRVTGLEDETNIRWAVGVNPAATEEIISRAESEGAGVLNADGKIPRRQSTQTTPEPPAAKPPVQRFASLPQKSQDLFNKAFESKDVDSLKQIVAKGNVAWNKEFENRTGIKLPNTVKGRNQAVADWSAQTKQADLDWDAQEKPESAEKAPEHTQFHSGLSRSNAEVDAAIASGNGVGVSAFDSLSAPMRKKLVDYANAGGKVFVDSGAFSAFKKGKEIDWDKTLFSYHELLTSVFPEKRKNMTIVAPDIVGDHQRTMDLQADLLDKFTPIIELGGQVIVPVQKENGGGEIWKHWADATNSFEEDQNESFIVGVPFNAEAWSQDDVLDFMRSRDKDAKQYSVPPQPFHLLGAGPDKVVKLFEAAAAEGLSTEGVSADAMPKSISQRKSGKAPEKPQETKPKAEPKQQETVSGDYRGVHRAPTGEHGEGSLDAMNRTYPDDIYSENAARFYGDSSDTKMDKQAAAIVSDMRGKPDAEITVYRAVPKGTKAGIEPGDWVTTVRKYAEGHGNRFDEGTDIIERTVKAGELFTEGNSLFEYGWSPKAEAPAAVTALEPAPAAITPAARRDALLTQAGPFRNPGKGFNRYIADAANRLEIASNKRLSNKKLNDLADVLKKSLDTQEKNAAKAKPKASPAKGRSLSAAVLEQGGISTASLKDYNLKELRADGLRGVIKPSGQPLDEITQVLVTSGALRVPENRTPADYLIEQLKANADRADANYSDAEMAKQEKAERELYEQRADFGVTEEVLDRLLERGEEAETHAVDEGENDFVPFTEREASEIIDTSFDFGANVKAETADEDAFVLKRPEPPKRKAEDFGVNANSKQGALFDDRRGKQADKEGQSLLFNTDPGDLNNPNTMENKAKATAPETKRQKAANEARAAVEAQKQKNARLNAVIVREFQKGDQSLGAFGVISDELARAIGQRIAGQIKLEFKQFDLFIKDLRASGTIDDAIIRGIKDNLIGGWNAGRERFGLDTATDASFEDSMSDTVDVDIEQIVEAAKAVTPTAKPVDAKAVTPVAEAAKTATPKSSPRTPPELPKKSPPVPPRPDKSRTIPEQSPDGDDEKKFGINRAKRAERRDVIGVGPEDIVSKVGHSFPELDAEAKQVAPGYAEEVFTKIGEGGEAADNASDRDVFVMLNHIAGMQNDTEKTQNALEAAQKAGDDSTVVELEAKLNVQVKEEVRLMNIAKSAGTAAGRALAAFKALLNNDMSLARLRMRLDAAADGNPTDAQAKALNALHAKFEAAVKDLEAKTKEADENLTRALTAEKIADELRAKAKATANPKATPKPPSSAPKEKPTGTRLQTALKELRKSKIAFSGVGLPLTPEHIEVAAAYIEEKVTTFKDFIEKLTKFYGKKPEAENLPVFQQAWDTAWENAKNPKPSTSTPSTPPEVSIEPDHPASLVGAAKALFRHFLSEGITNTDAVIDAVHNELQNQFPDEIGERLDTMKAIVDYDKIRTLSKDPLDILVADKRAVVQMEVHIARMKDGMPPNLLDPRHPQSDEQRNKRKEVNEAKRKGGFVVTDPERQAKSALDSLETRLRHSISDTMNEIANKARTVPDKTVSQTSNTTEDLKAYLALVQGMHKAIFGDRKMTQEQRLKAAEAAAVKNEAFWNDRLARAKAGDFSTGRTIPNPVTSANIAAIKARSETAKAQVAELKELAGPDPKALEISDARYLTSLLHQQATKLARIADITARSAAGDFTPERNLSKEKRETNAQRRKSDASIRDARIEQDKTTRDLNELIEQTRLSNLTYVDLAKRVPGGVISLARDMAFGGELSFILKQGAPHVFGTLAPAGKLGRAGYEAITGNTAAAKVKLRQARQGYGKLGRALAGSLKAFLWKTDTELARSEDAIKQRPGYKNGMYKAMGVPVEDGGTLTVKEEVFLTNLVETGGLALDKMFPGFKGFRDGRPVFTQYAHNLNVANRFSNATKVFMSTIRADIADNAAEVWTMKRGEMTPAEARSLGRVTNIVTGKGDMKSIGMDNEQALGFLGRLFISAPWLKSRFDMVLDPVLSLNPWSSRRTLESRKIAAEVYVDAAAGVAAYYGAVVLAAMFYNDDDDEKPTVEWDSTSSDFMKPRFGKTRLDPLFGLQQIFVMGSRMYHGTYKDHRGDIQKREGNSDLFELGGQFLKGRLHPWIQAAAAIYTQQDFSGQPTTTAEVLKRMPIPVTYPDIVEASKNRGIPASTAFGIFGFIGGGLQTNQPRTKDRRDIAEELRIMQRKINNPNTPADLRKSLQGQADTMLEAHLVNAVKADAHDNDNTVVEDLATNHKPGTPLFPELTEAIQKEKYDIIMNASARVSSDRRFKSNDEKLEFSGDDDKGRNIARSLIPLMIPNVDEAIKLYDDAYIKANKTLTELKKGVEGNTIKVIKPSVAAGRYRIKQLYLQQ